MARKETPVLTAENAELIAEAVRRWAASGEGRKVLSEGLQRAECLATQFREAERIDPESLKKPVTL